MQACQSILPKDTKKPFNVDNVRVAKILGSGVLSSSVVKGMVFKRQIEGEITHIQHAKARMRSDGGVVSNFRV